MSTAREPRVFFPQIPHRKEGDTWMPTFNVSPAERFGEIIQLLPPTAQFYGTQEITRQIKQRLHELDYREGDYIVPIGSPAIMMATGILASRITNAGVKLLVWDKQTKGYVPCDLNL